MSSQWNSKLSSVLSVTALRLLFRLFFALFGFSPSATTPTAATASGTAAMRQRVAAAATESANNLTLRFF